MKRSLILSLAIASSAVAAAQVHVSKLFDTATIDALPAPVVTPDIEFAAMGGGGQFVFLNADVTGDSDGFAVIRSGTGVMGPLTVLAGANEVLAAVDAANGTAGPPAALNVRGLAVDSQGRVILATDTSTDAYLIRISGGIDSPAITVEVIAGAASPNLVDGATGLACVGTTAYVLRERNFAAAGNDPQDSIASFSTSGVANAAQAGSIFVNELTLTGAGAFNQPAADMAMNGIAAYTGSGLIVLNSGSASANDSVALVTSAGAVSILKAGTAFESDLAYTDVGFEDIHADVSTGDVYLWLNNFNTPTTYGNAFLKVPGGTGTTQILATEAEIAADSDYGPVSTGMFTNNQGFIYYDGGVVWTDDETEAVYKVTRSSSVSEWSLFE